MKKVKILYFVDRLKTGGIQTYIRNVMRYMDLKRLQIDFLLFDDGNKYEMENFFRALGCGIYKVTRLQTSPVKSLAELNVFFKKHPDYQIVEAHGSSKGAVILYFAKKYGIGCRVSHSHCTGFSSERLIDRLIGELLKVANCRLATDYFACSEAAWDWLFNHWYSRKLPQQIIKSVVDVEKYRYDGVVRKDVRRELNLGNSFVVGNVSRFAPVKNHVFLIDIFNEILKINPGSKLMLIGEGELLKSAKQQCERLGISENVIFTGLRNDVDRMLQAIDVFLMPSLFEGLPAACVEAQASGVPCVFSDAITQECAVLPESVFMSLNASAKEWAEKVYEIGNNYVRTDTSVLMRKYGYDVKETAARLTDFYLGKAKSGN